MASVPQPRRRTIVATYADAARARRALMKLERAGIDAVNITMSGRPMQRAARHLDKRTGDARASGHVMRRVLLGAVAGALIGAAAALAGGIGFNAMGTGPLITSGTMALVGLIALGTSAAGGIIGAIASLGLGRQWELTFDETARNGGVVLEIASDDARDMERARVAIPSTDPISVDER